MNELSVIAPKDAAVARPQPTAIDILQAAVEKGITAENVAVVKEIRQMVREEQEHNAKLAFNRAFFELRKEMPVVYADREVKTDSGAVAFQYCSPQEIKDILEPLMLRHGFTTMTSQEMDGETKVTVTVSLLHEAGHSVNGTFTIRVGQENRLVKGPQVVAGATTAAERHCLIKLFGLRTRVNADDDARNVGEPITAEQAFELERMVKEKNRDAAAFLKFAGATSFQTIMSSRLEECRKMLQKAKAL